MPHDALSLLRGIEDALDTERALLRTASFAFLPDLAARKSRLIGQLATADVTRHKAALARIRDKARLNLALFEAAQRGLAAADARIREVRENAQNLATYDHSGRRTNLPTGAALHERRA